ncbi:MAG TPA: hypothetical protein VN607_05320 [Gemmatimonadaceae bacterium]|nr:hypothetical protein [Gemmatimonadaceae bacterium]
MSRMERTSEYPIERDGQRRQGPERRRGERLRAHAKQALWWASSVAALLYCVTTLGKLGGSAFHLAVAAQSLDASVATLGPRLDQLSRREDSLLVNQGLMASHMAKLDTITLQQQRAIQALTVRLDKGRRP